MRFVSRLIGFATNHYLLVAALLVLLVLLLLPSPQGGKSLSTRELTALVNADQAVVLDIRPAKEFASGHIVDALNIPADKLNSRMTELEKYKGKTIILVDAMGQHSGTWGGVLRRPASTPPAASGGIGGWRGDNLPLVK
ncbi:rhodanese-like domain-containing protein [Pseudomonas aeruginosa]